jgi:hypothetical protein
MLLLLLLLVAIVLTSSAPSPYACTVCQLVASVADHYLESNATVSEVETKVKAICAYAGNEAQLCDAFVDFAGESCASAGSPRSRLTRLSKTQCRFWPPTSPTPPSRPLFAKTLAFARRPVAANDANEAKTVV